MPGFRGDDMATAPPGGRIDKNSLAEMDCVQCTHGPSHDGVGSIRPCLRGHKRS